MLSTRNSQRNNLWAHCNKAFLTIHKIFTLFSLNIASCCRDVEMTYTERIYTGVYYVYTDIKIVTYSKLEVCSCNLCYMLYIAPIYLYFPAHVYISCSRWNIPDEIASSLEDVFNINLPVSQPGFQASLLLQSLTKWVVTYPQNFPIQRWFPINKNVMRSYREQITNVL